MSRECDCCNAEDVKTEPYDHTPFPRGTAEKKMRNLCNLCAGTMTSVYALQYPEQHNNDSVEVMRTVCFVGNEILKALRKKGA